MSTPTPTSPAPPTTWLDVAPDDPFGLATLPYGVFSTVDSPSPRVGVRIGASVLDVATLASSAAARGGEDRSPLDPAVWSRPSLNALLAAGPTAWASARSWLTRVLSSPAARELVEPHLLPLDRATMHLPVEVADYVDFYAGEQHALRVSEIFGRSGLHPSWKHLPVGYHGRAGTVVVDGTDVVRPVGQRRGAQGDDPDVGPSTALDVECELGFVIGGGTTQGTRVPVSRASAHLFGVVLLNDWSARDVQAWESVPLGPFLGKSFATSISAWVTPMAALATARVPVPGQDDPVPPPYLTDDGAPARGLDLRLELRINDSLVTTPRARDLYWSPEQMVAHLTVGGASLRDGDLLGSGTISGVDEGSIGCLLELTRGGTEPVTLDDGSSRTYLRDGDRVSITAVAPGPGGSRVGLGEVSGRVRRAV